MYGAGAVGYVVGEVTHSRGRVPHSHVVVTSRIVLPSEVMAWFGTAPQGKRHCIERQRNGVARLGNVQTCNGNDP